MTEAMEVIAEVQLKSVKGDDNTEMLVTCKIVILKKSFFFLLPTSVRKSRVTRRNEI